MKIKLLLLAIVIATTAQAQSTEGKKVDKLINNTIKSLKKLDTADVSTFRAMMISNEGIQAFIDALVIEEEYKEEIRANVKDGMFENALEESFQDFIRITHNMEINWKRIAFEDFVFEMRKRDGTKQVRGDLFFAEGEKHLQVQLTAALLNDKYEIIELERLRGARIADKDEIAREIEQAIEEAEMYEENTELDPGERVVVPPPPPPMEIKEPDNRTREERIAMEVIDFPDVEAQFPGGTGALQKYIMENVKYPVEALENGIQGRVYLSFVVEKDGSLTQIKVERGVSPELDREAKRVVRAMPKWKPGEAAGRTVRTRCRLPIVFVLEDDKEE